METDATQHALLNRIPPVMSVKLYVMSVETIKQNTQKFVTTWIQMMGRVVPLTVYQYSQHGPVQEEQVAHQIHVFQNIVMASLLGLNNVTITILTIWMDVQIQE